MMAWVSVFILIISFICPHNSDELILPESCATDKNAIQYMTTSLNIISSASIILPFGEIIKPILSGTSKVLPFAIKLFGSSHDNSINIWQCLQPKIEELAEKSAQNEIRNYIDTTMKGRLDKIQRQMDILNDVCENIQECLSEIKNTFDLINSYSPNLFTDPSDIY
eukprot:196356_1